MNFELHLKNGETHEIALPDAAKTYRAIVWIPKDSDKKKEVTNFLILPDDVELVNEIIKD